MIVFLIVVAICIGVLYRFVSREAALWVAVLAGIALVLLLVGVFDVDLD